MLDADVPELLCFDARTGPKPDGAHENPQGPAAKAPDRGQIATPLIVRGCEDEHGARDIKLPRPGITPRRQPGGGAR